MANQMPISNSTQVTKQILTLGALHGQVKIGLPLLRLQGDNLASKNGFFVPVLRLKDSEPLLKPLSRSNISQIRRFLRSRSFRCPSGTNSRPRQHSPTPRRCSWPPNTDALWWHESGPNQDPLSAVASLSSSCLWPYRFGACFWNEV